MRSPVLLANSQAISSMIEMLTSVHHYINGTSGSQRQMMDWIDDKFLAGFL